MGVARSPHQVTSITPAGYGAPGSNHGGLCAVPRRETVTTWDCGAESPFSVSYVRPELSDHCARVDGLADHIRGSFDPLFREPYVGGGEIG